MDLITSQPSFPWEISWLVTDVITLRKWGWKETNLNTDGVIIQKPLQHLVHNFMSQKHLFWQLNVQDSLWLKGQCGSIGHLSKSNR